MIEVWIRVEVENVVRSDLMNEGGCIRGNEEEYQSTSSLSRCSLS
jgi:predicted transcriptional regulator with HTH domain